MKPENKNIYFASDFHLGVPDRQSSLQREKKLIRWFEVVQQDAEAIYLMGDLFDFWYEYKTVVPKGYTRLFSKLAELTENGIPIHFFKGNHDFWAFDYLNEEAGVTLHDGSQVIELKGSKFLLAHGDGLGPGDHKYKFLKKIFLSRINQALFRWLHPDLGTKMGLYFSRGSRISKMLKSEKDQSYALHEKEFLLEFARQQSKEDPSIQYYVFGHRHIPVITRITEKSDCIILGDWVKLFSYGVFDGKSFELRYFEKE